MYERIDLPDDSLLRLRILGDITHRESQELAHLIQYRFQQYGPVRLLVVYEASPGLMGAEGLYDNLRFVKLVSENLAKLAVMGHQDWEDTWIGLFGLFGGIQTEYYSNNQMEAALAWLKE